LLISSSVVVFRFYHLSKKAFVYKVNFISYSFID